MVTIELKMSGPIPVLRRRVLACAPYDIMAIKTGPDR
jgi:hypothetical protein